MTFADNYDLRIPKANFNSVASALDALLVTYQRSAATSTINTASTSLVDYTGASISITNATGELIVVYAQISASNSTAAAEVKMCIREDSTDLSAYTLTSSSGSTGGDVGMISYLDVRAPTPGAHTYKIRWRAGSNTAYSAGYLLWAMTIQNT